MIPYAAKINAESVRTRNILRTTEMKITLRNHKKNCDIREMYDQICQTWSNRFEAEDNNREIMSSE